MGKFYNTVGMKNHFTMDGGGKRLVVTFKRQEFWKFIGFIILEVSYGKKGHKFWIEIPKASCRMAPTKLRRDVCGKNNLHKVCWYHYRHFTSMIAIELFYPTQLCSFLGCFLEY